MALKRRFIIFLGIFAAVFLGFLLAWFKGPLSLLAQSPGGGPGDGLKFQILSARIDESRRPVVTFRVTDAAGRPLALSDLDPLAGAPALYTIAKLRQDEKTGLTEYVNYIINTIPGRPFVMEGKTVQAALASATQPGVDSMGSYSDQGGGTFVYTFSTALPADFDWNSTHRIGGQVSRGNRKWIGNDVIDFMPSGAAVAGTWLRRSPATGAMTPWPSTVEPGGTPDSALPATPPRT